MKALVFITIQMITVSLLACPDFSGNYLRDYDAEEITIAQPNCDKITYITSEREYPYVIDGKESLVGKYDIEGSEPGSIIASVEIYQSRAFKGKMLITRGRAKTFYPDTGETEEQISVQKAV